MYPSVAIKHLLWWVTQQRKITFEKEKTIILEFTINCEVFHICAVNSKDILKGETCAKEKCPNNKKISYLATLCETKTGKKYIFICHPVYLDLVLK